MNFRTGLGFALMVAIAGLGVLVDHGARRQNTYHYSNAARTHERFPCRRFKPRSNRCRASKALPVRGGYARRADYERREKSHEQGAMDQKRREEMKRILEYYAVGIAPPPPGNVKGKEIKSQLVQGGKVKYRLVHLTFGPKESLSLDIGIFTPAEGGPFPAVIMPGGTPPDGTSLPRLPQGPGQGTGVDALLAVQSETLPPPPVGLRRSLDRNVSRLAMQPWPMAMPT